MVRKNIVASTLLMALAGPVWAANTLTVRAIDSYSLSRHFEYIGPAPYLAYRHRENEITIQAYPAAKKFIGETMISPKTDGSHSIQQIDFIALVCNSWPRNSVTEADHASSIEQKKQLLQIEVVAFAEELFAEKLAETDVAAMKVNDKIEKPAFTLSYQESPAKCDGNGGDSVQYKIFITP